MTVLAAQVQGQGQAGQCQAARGVPAMALALTVLLDWHLDRRGESLARLAVANLVRLHRLQVALMLRRMSQAMSQAMP